MPFTAPQYTPCQPTCAASSLTSTGELLLGCATGGSGDDSSSAAALTPAVPGTASKRAMSASRGMRAGTAAARVQEEGCGGEIMVAAGLHKPSSSHLQLPAAAQSRHLRHQCRSISGEAMRALVS